MVTLRPRLGFGTLDVATKRADALPALRDALGLGPSKPSSQQSSAGTEQPTDAAR